MKLGGLGFQALLKHKTTGAGARTSAERYTHSKGLHIIAESSHLVRPCFVLQHAPANGLVKTFAVSRQKLVRRGVEVSSYSNALCFIHPDFTFACATLTALCALEMLVCNKCSCAPVDRSRSSSGPEQLACKNIHSWTVGQSG